jgi:signal transduction histidine kinase
MEDGTMSAAAHTGRAHPARRRGRGATESERALERRLLRLALDVHDGPMQNLAVIGFGLGDLRRRIRAVVPEEHHEKIDESMEHITVELGRVECELRALITALEHGATTSIPLLDAIELEVRAFVKRTGLEVELDFDGAARAETDSQRIALQSVTRAALANVARHANATTVRISVASGADTIRLEIEDDGRGFDPDIPRIGRFGLAGMRERVELLGGGFSVASCAGGPTRIVAELKTWRPDSQAAN